MPRPTRPIEVRIKAYGQQLGMDLDGEEFSILTDMFAEGSCVYCGTESDLTLEHILPISRGGTNDILNLAAACWDCNVRKNDKTTEEFFQWASDHNWRTIQLVESSPECEPTISRSCGGITQDSELKDVPARQGYLQKSRK